MSGFAFSVRGGKFCRGEGESFVDCSNAGANNINLTLEHPVCTRQVVKV